MKLHLRPGSHLWRIVRWLGVISLLCLSLCDIEAQTDAAGAEQAAALFDYGRLRSTPMEKKSNRRPVKKISKSVGEAVEANRYADPIRKMRQSDGTLVEVDLGSRFRILLENGMRRGWGPWRGLTVETRPTNSIGLLAYRRPTGEKVIIKNFPNRVPEGSIISMVACYLPDESDDIEILDYGIVANSERKELSAEMFSDEHITPIKSATEATNRISIERKEAGK